MSSRISTGWKLAMSGFSVIKKNKQLILFPILSGTAMIITTVSFILILLAGMGWDVDNVIDKSTPLDYLLAFIFYLVNYFVIIFFNMAIIHCARLHFAGEEVTLSKGIAFSMSRITDILAWSFLAATVGLILKAIEDNLGKIGQLISGLLGLAWSVTTFFVIPIIAYERLNPIDAFKRSASIMKEKWGESLAATFSFGFIKFIGILVIALPLFLIGREVNLMVGIGAGLLAGFIVLAIVSAAEMVFVAAVYQHMNNVPITDFDTHTLDAAFITKEKKSFF